MEWLHGRGVCASGAQRQQTVENHVTNILFTELRRSLAGAIGAYDGNNVGVNGESGIRARDIVGDDEVEPFTLEFVGGVDFEVFGFRGESDNDTIAFLCSQPRKFVGNRRKLE